MDKWRGKVFKSNHPHQTVPIITTYKEVDILRYTILVYDSLGNSKEL